MKTEKTPYKQREYLADYITQHLHNLQDYAIRLTHNTDDAHDLIQETVYRSMHNAQKYNEQNSAGAWLFTIMHNIYINECKSLHRSLTTQYDVELLDCIDDNDTVEQLSTLEELYSAIDKLNLRDRKIIELRINGASYKDIAASMNMRDGTVKSSLHRIKEQLRCHLKHKL